METELLPVLWVSLEVAAITSAVVMVLSLWLGALFARPRQRWLRWAEILVYVPMAMPPVALGFGLLLLVGPKSVLGHMLHEAHFDIAFTFWGAVLASCTASLGIGVRTMRTAYQALDPHYSEIARLHGANSWQVFCTIILPLLRPSLVSGSILVFIRALGEFGATIILAGNTLGETRTLALAIWTSLQMPDQEHETWLLVLVAVIVSFIALIVSELMVFRGQKV